MPVTIQEAIAQADGLEPNTFPLDYKLRLLSDLDLMIREEVLARYEEPAADWAPYHRQTPLDTQLLVPEPDAELYKYYLAGVFCYNRHENENANSHFRFWEAAFDRFHHRYNRTHTHRRQRLTYF